MSDKNMNKHDEISSTEMQTIIQKMQDYQFELEKQNQLQQLLINISTTSINLPMNVIESNIDGYLRDMAIFVNADRAYIFDYDFKNQICINTHEWCADEIEPQINELQAIPLSVLEEWLKKHLKGESIFIPDVNALPEGYGRETLMEQDIKSLLTVPLMNIDECIGFVGFDSVQKHHNYSDNELKLLTVFAKMLLNMHLRKKTEEELVQAKDDWENTFDSLTDMVTIHDRNFNIIKANKSARQMFSKDSSDIKCYSCYHGLQKPLDSCPCCKSIETLQPCISERYEPHLNKYLEIQAIPRFDINHQCIGLIHVVRDITERKHAEYIRKESEERKKVIVDTLSEGVSLNEMILNDNGEMIDYKILEVNDAYYQVTHLAKDNDVIGSLATNLYNMNTNVIKDFWLNHKDVAETIHTEITTPITNRIFSISTSPFKDNKFVTTFRDITENKQTEDALKKSEEQYRFLIENSHDIIYALTADGIFTFVSPSWTVIIGHPVSDVTGKSFKDFVHPDDIPGCLEWLQKVIETGQRQSGIEYRVRHTDDTWHWHTSSAVPFKDNTGKVAGFYGTARDITDRKIAEEALLEAEWKFRALFEQGPIGVAYHKMIYDTDGKPIDYYFIDANKSYVELTGVDPRGLTVTKAFPGIENHSFDWIGTYANVAKTGESIRLEQYFESNKRWYDCVAYQYKPDYFVAAFIDITNRKQVEITLRENEEKLRALFSILPTGVSILDSNYKIVEMNPALENILDISYIDFIEGKYNNRKYLRSDGSIKPANEFASHLAFSENRIVMNEVTGVVKENDEIIWTSVSAVPMPDNGVVMVTTDITERKRMEEALQQSEARYRSILDASPDDITITDMTGTIVMTSPRAISMFGYNTEEDGIGRSITEFVTPQDRERSMMNLKLKLNGINTGPNEYLGLRADGSTLEIESNSEFIRDADGKPINIVFVIRDITERKKAEKALFESEAKFRNLVWDMQVGIILQNQKAEIILSNPTALELLGLTEDQLLGKTSFDPDWNVIHEDGSPFPGHTHPVPQAIATGLPVHDAIMGVYRPLIGDRVWLLVDAEPQMNPDGTVFQVVCSFINITERKHAEDAMVISEERFRAISEYSHSAICIIDETAKIVYINNIMLEISGYSREQIMSTHSFIAFVAPESVEFVAGNFMQFVAGKEYQHHYEFYIIRADGEKRLLEKYMTHYVDKQGKKNLIISMLDITDTRRAEEEKLKLESQLQQAQKMESVGRLAGGVAHDFNNMLQAILGNADIAMMETAEDDPIRESLVEICKAAERSADLTRQLLAFARKQTVAPRVLNLNDTVAGMIKMLKRLIGEDIELEWIPEAGLWPVKIDPSQIDQIMANLCVNARDAISGIGRITIESKNSIIDDFFCTNHPDFIPGDYMVLTISDSGCGMDKETMSHLFEPFFTTKGIGKGTGLGLATVYGVIKQNNGFINVYSEVGKGTTFAIYLPRYQGNTGKSQQNETEKSNKQGKETILLVEDEMPILTLTTTMLQRLGYNVLPASTPGEAIRIAEDYDGDIDLLMTDVIMPEMNGRDLALNIITFYPNIGRLFMSGYTADIIAHHGVLDKGIHFLQKPFSLKDLSNIIRESLDN